MALYAVTSPALVGVYGADPTIYISGGGSQNITGSGTVASQSSTLVGNAYRVIVDQGDFEYLVAGSATVSGTLSVNGANVIVGTGSGIVSAQSAHLSGLFNVSSQPTSHYIELVFRNGSGKWNQSVQYTYAFFDQSMPNQLGLPVALGTAVIDANGSTTIQLPNTTLHTGDIGYIVMSNTDGDPDHAWQQHSGPVRVY